MPSKNTVKVYTENSFYHLYNRGVEKRIIFEDELDHKVFLDYLSEYLSPPKKIEEFVKKFYIKGSTFKGIPRQPNNFHGRIELHSFCLMPNHFHLLVKQNDKTAIKEFMQSLSTRYSIYFNKRHSRVGPLFQGIYKAVIIENDTYLLHLSRYIHLNPSEYASNLESAYSSYATYLKMTDTPWITTSFILKFFEKSTNILFQKTTNYKDFVENYKQDSSSILGRFTLE